MQKHILEIAIGSTVGKCRYMVKEGMYILLKNLHALSLAKIAWELLLIRHNASTKTNSYK